MRATRSFRRWVGLLAMGTTSACFIHDEPQAEGPPIVPAGAEVRFTLHAGRDVREAKVEGRRMFGPAMDVVDFADGIRGRTNRGVVDLRVSGSLVEGLVGGGRTELHVKKGPHGVQVDGMFASAMTHLAIDKNGFTGYLGPCGYALRRGEKATEFEGTRHCGARQEVVYLTVPAQPLAVSTAEQMALLVLFMG